MNRFLLKNKTHFSCILCCAFALASCGGNKDSSGKESPSSPQTKVTPPFDAAPKIDAAIVIRDAAPAIDAALSPTDAAPPQNRPQTSKKPNKHPISQLAGYWHGSAVVPSYGSVIASVRLNKQGKGQFTVKVAGFTKTGPVKILSWNGKRITARAKGIQKTIPAKLAGNALTLQLPMIGRVVVHR